MNHLNNNRNILIILGIVVLILFFSILFVRNIQKKAVSQPFKNLPEIGKINSETSLKFENEYGVDLNSMQVKSSKNNIEKLRKELPYFNSVTTNDGLKIDIEISDSTLDLQDWILLVNIYGPDYQIEKDDPEYNKNKNAFLEGANIAINFIREIGVDPDGLIIDWGTREFIDKKAFEWLSE